MRVIGLPASPSLLSGLLAKPPRGFAFSPRYLKGCAKGKSFSKEVPANRREKGEKCGLCLAEQERTAAVVTRNPGLADHGLLQFVRTAGLAGQKRADHVFVFLPIEAAG